MALVLLAPLASVAPGCGGQSVGEEEIPPPSCVDLCEKGKRERCPGADMLGCEEGCLGDDLLSEEAGCQNEREATLYCTAELEDICTLREDCESEIEGLRECYREFCEDSDFPLCAPFR